MGAAGENPGGESPMRVPMQYSEEVFPIRHLSNQRSHQDPGEQGQIRIMDGKNSGGVCIARYVAADPAFLFHKRQQTYGIADGSEKESIFSSALSRKENQ